MALFRLFVDSSTGVDIDPEYDFSDSGSKIETVHRSNDGSEYRYLWGDFKLLKFTVRFVNSSFACQVNSWWGDSTELKFMEVGVAASEIDVRVVNKKKPVDKNISPYRSLFKGVIELSTF